MLQRSLLLLPLLCVCATCTPAAGPRADRLAAPADGQSVITLACERAGTVWALDAADGVVAAEPAGAPDGQAVMRLRSAGKPGNVRVRWCGGELTLTFHQKYADIDGDGIPDAAELGAEQDRLAFRDWLLRIAQSQFLRTSPAWNPAERDCAGLLRFAWREALRRHDADWQQRTGIVIDKNLPDVRAFVYPEVPLLGERLFRTGPGPDDFGVFADAETLVRYNLRQLGRDTALAGAGDVLVFCHQQSGESIWHLMLVVSPQAGGLRLVYHTGGGGGVKLVDAGYLAQSAVFCPAEWNDSFLGVYRLHILE